MKKLLYLIIGVVLLMACSERQEYVRMLGVSQAYITKMRNNMMPKLFGMEGSSKELDEKLMQFT